MMAALEVLKWGGADEPYQNVNAKATTKSYVVLNENGAMDGARIDLPNPHFGKESAAFSMNSTKADGETFVAVDAAQFRGNLDFQKFALQIYLLQGDKLVEVTNERFIGKLDNNNAGNTLIRFFDIRSN